MYKKKSFRTVYFTKATCFLHDKIPTRFSSSESKLYKLSGAHGQEQVSKAAKALETRLEKLEKKEKPKDLSQAQFDVQYHTPIHSKVALQFNKATKKIGDRTLFKNMNGTIAPGAKACYFRGKRKRQNNFVQHASCK